MSRNYLRCRLCRQRLARTHHSGRTDFLVEGVHDADGAVRLTCSCGAVQTWRPKALAVRA